MKIRFVLLSVLSLFLATALLAQPQRMTPQERTDRLATQLALSADQKAKVLDLFTKQDEARQKAFTQGDREANRAAMEKLREETTKEMKSILTPEQYTKYESLRREMGPRGGMRGEAPGGPRRLSAQERTDQLAKDLSLTAEQQTKVLELFTQQEKEQQKAFSSTKDQPMRTGMEKQRTQMDKKMKAILTKTQYAKYQEMQAKRPPDPLEKKAE